MLRSRNNTKATLYLPVAGILIFFILYYLAALYYPGGSQHNNSEAGFSWLHNYWCNLLDERAINGLPNTARPIALAAMLVLCVSLITFWWQFPIYTPLRKFARQSIRIFGTLAMINALFLFTPISHDLVVNLSSGLGMLATLGIVAGLFYNRWWSLFYFSLFNMFLVLINNVFYYTGGLIDYLPVVQKISFLSFLLWVFLICIKTIRYSYSKTPS